MPHHFKITAEPCIDSDEFVWSLVAYDGGVFMDGYAPTENEAWEVAKTEREELEKEMFG